MTDVIRELPLDERPRERLLKHGPSLLSNAELVAILLGSGTRGRNAVQLARKLLGGGLRSLSGAAPAELTRNSGVGVAKAARLAAAFELAERARNDKVAEAPPPRFDLQDFGTDLVRRMHKYRQERLGVALLDAQHRLIDERDVFIGTINHALVSTRDVVAYALEKTAVAVVLYHNHPSGEASPSGDDIAFTRRVKEALAMFDIDLIDHLVVGEHKFALICASGAVR